MYPAPPNCGSAPSDEKTGPNSTIQITGWMSDMTGPQTWRNVEISQRRSTCPVCVNHPAR